MRVVGNGLISDLTARPADRRFAAFASLCPLQSGAILSSFQVGAAKHAPDSTIGLCRSRDGGATWHSIPVDFSRVFGGVPGSFPGGEIVEVKPGLLMLCTTWFNRSEPSRPLFDPVTEGILRTKQLRSFSSDEGDSWSEWEELSVGDLRGCALTGPLLRWEDGTIAFPFESYKEYDDPTPHRHAAWLETSSDGGRSFGDPWLVAQDPTHRAYFWDQRLCPLGDSGEFIAMFWTHDLRSKQDIAVHLRRGSAHGPSDATTSILATNIAGQIAAPAVLDDGRWLAFVVDRAAPCTMKLWVSHDEGRTWPEEQALVVYRHEERAALSQGQEDVDYGQYWDDMLKWTFGHPAIRVLDDGSVLLAFYAGSPEGTSIHWSQVDPEISNASQGAVARKIHASAAAAHHRHIGQANGQADGQDQSQRYDLENTR